MGAGHRWHDSAALWAARGAMSGGNGRVRVPPPDGNAGTEAPRPPAGGGRAAGVGGAAAGSAAGTAVTWEPVALRWFKNRAGPSRQPGRAGYGYQRSRTGSDAISATPKHYLYAAAPAGRIRPTIKPRVVLEKTPPRR